jgi:hypothetical protein
VSLGQARKILSYKGIGHPAPQDTSNYLECLGPLDGDAISLTCPDLLDSAAPPYTLAATLALSGTTLTVIRDDGTTETYDYYGPSTYNQPTSTAARRAAACPDSG